MSSVVVVVVLSLLLVGVDCIVDFCSINNYPTNTTWLQFTKEISTKEYVMYNKFKSLHCCAKGYRSIEWFKDGKAYPWPTDVSNLILYPESANQTIYSQTMVQTDAGNYSCIISNDTHQHLHTIHLNVIDASGYSGSPLPTYQPEDQQVNAGSIARLFCEAFVGRIDLPDAHNEVSWRRADKNVSFGHLKRFRQTTELREDSQVLGSRLVINGVKKEDYGLYVCSISNTWFQVADFPVWLTETESNLGPMTDRLAYKRLLLILAVVFLTVGTLVAIYVRFNVTLRRLLKDKFAKVEIDDGKEYDVLVCHHESDAEFVAGVLVPTLESRYNYRCFTTVLDGTVDHWSHALSVEVASKSRRLLAVLSPSLLCGVWNSDAIAHALRQLQALHSSVVCVNLQVVPKSDFSKGDSVLSRPRHRVHMLTWDKDVRLGGTFWSALRLRLPPRRPTVAETEFNASTCAAAGIGVNHHRGHLVSSNESLEVLV